MRLTKVAFGPNPEAVRILNFWAGKSTAEQMDYIMERLVVLTEE